MEREISFSGAFPVVARTTMRPGGWHIGFLCPNCRLHFAVMEDPTESGALTLSGPARFQATCPHCKQEREYPVADMVVFEAAQGGPTSSA
jgi:hypothetical protein